MGGNSHRFQGLGCKHLCRVALFYPLHLYSCPIWHASSVSTWLRSESDSGPLLWSKVWAVPPCLAMDVRQIKFLDSVSFWSPSLGTQLQENIDSLHTCTRTWTRARACKDTHTHTLSELRNVRHLWCRSWGVHSAVTLLGCKWTLGFGLWTLRFPGSETLRKLYNLSELLFSICKFNENKVLASWNCCKDKTRVFVKCPEHGNYSVVAAANYFFWKFVALIAPYAHIFFSV